MIGEARAVHRLDMGVDGVVVAVEQVQALGDAGLGAPEHREIATALDAVVTVQVLEEGREGLDKGDVDGAGVGLALADEVGHARRLAAKAVVHVQPEAGHLGQGRIGPAVARSLGQQAAHGLGQAWAALKRVVRQGRWSWR